MIDSCYEIPELHFIMNVSTINMCLCLSGMKKAKCITPSTNCTWSYWVPTKARWSQNTLSAPLRTSALTLTTGRRWVAVPAVCLGSRARIPGCHCVSLCWPVGVTCVLRLRTWGEIRPLPAPSEEQLLESVLPNYVHWQLSDCQANQEQLLGRTFRNLLEKWFPARDVIRDVHALRNYANISQL